MSDRPSRRAFAARPADPEQWIKSANRLLKNPLAYRVGE
jgi:hypothetical protein